MTYSKKRLTVVLFVWLAVGVGAVSVYGLPEVSLVQNAEATHCDTSLGNCMFPTEAHRGGIVLGVGRLSGQGATTFNVGNAPDTFLPPGRPVDTDEAVPLGINNLDPADSFFLYKSWKYEDTSVSPTEDNADVYLWIGTGTANLVTESRTDKGDARNPSATCGGGNGFRDGCDLLLYGGEVSAGEFNVETASINTGSLLPDLELSPTATNYWVDDPEQDTCTGVGLSGIEVCLSLIEDGSLTQGFIKELDLTLYNFMVRTHYARAVQSPASSGGGTEYDKLLTIQDGYLEIRHGKGADRSRVLDTSNTRSGSANWQEPVVRAGDETYRHGVGQGFECDGNPDGDDDCSPGQKPTGGTESQGSYDDVHR
ncbi:hypothetical protein EGH25_08550 [Haladaptatus sp. F3-133]|uniref:Uncharacterized protein n=1 Tax=Halorutilus salinus TaxID=2487751 RepID=A0A9Q4GJ03_9EURY|nr:hypothetical protein [Halorutilus salinus]MCX2819398.1 hypothetical protein [Halorutilus salinus]